MERTELETRKSEKGFTLVELAIVMIIIGLLIGGILKGQELIANAQIAATVSQVKGYEAATTTFRDKYNALPGDMANVAARLANCNAPCDTDGDGNGRLDDAFGTQSAGEGAQFFLHLSASDLIGGISNDGTGVWGDIFPAAEIEGGFFIGFADGTDEGGSNASPFPGHYLILALDPDAAPAGVALNGNEAFRIDSKIDDGAPTTGSVFPAVADGCDDGTVYTEADTAQNCDLAIRIQ